MNKKPTIIHWFRRDLRVSDNPALKFAAEWGKVVPIFILDDTNSKEHAIGQAGRVWLFHSLQQLDKQLGGTLRCFKGNPEDILMLLFNKEKATGITWNHAYEPWQIKRDKQIETNLTKTGAKVKSFNGSLLWEPSNDLKPDGSPYRVFTPYYRKGCLNAHPPRLPEQLISISFLPKTELIKNSVDTLRLLSGKRWEKEIVENWSIGEKGAKKQLDNFLQQGILDYKEGRNFPLKNNVSMLSPFIHWGEISVNEVWYTANELLKTQPTLQNNIDGFLSQLAWREFSYHLLYHFPELPSTNLQARFDYFPWEVNHKALRAWQRGKTGVPMVDAGMRQLRKTGYMHNRLRMIVGSFLVKNLRIHWHFGQAWFWETLFDADLANNSAGWQWVAGCGVDAAPYFRIFNPVLQGLKFDPSGNFIRKFIPELRNMPNKYIFQPWEAPRAVLEAAEVQLGHNYPSPLVNIKDSRQQALAAFSSIKSVNTVKSGTIFP